MIDRTLTCKQCGDRFTWSASEQEFYASRGLQNPPGRCPSCRAARRASIDRTADRLGYGGARETYTATCASCGREARVPFQPRGDRPVYCSDCFEKQRARRPARY